MEDEVGGGRRREEGGGGRIYPQQIFSHLIVQEELFLERFNEFFSQIILTTPGDLSINIVYSYSFFSNLFHVIIYVNTLCVV